MKVPSLTLYPTVSRFTAYVRRIKAIYFIFFLIVALLFLAMLVHAYGVLEFDLAITNAMQANRIVGLDALAKAITILGDTGVYLVVACLAAYYFWRNNFPKAAVIQLASLIAYPINVAIKDAVERARPISDLVKIISPAGGFSFPSGHAMITMTVYGVLAYLLWTNLKVSRRWIIPTVAFGVIFLVGLSRIYLGVHWFSDVMGGWIAGLVLLLILAEIHKSLVTFIGYKKREALEGN